MNSNLKDLTLDIKKESLYCLNEDKDHEVKNIAINSDDNYLRSEVNGKLLISFAFQSVSKVKSIYIEMKNKDESASKMDIYVNRLNMNFSSNGSGTIGSRMLT